MATGRSKLYRRIFTGVLRISNVYIINLKEKSAFGALFSFSLQLLLSVQHDVEDNVVFT